MNIKTCYFIDSIKSVLILQTKNQDNASYCPSIFFAFLIGCLFDDKTEEKRRCSEKK